MTSHSIRISLLLHLNIKTLRSNLNDFHTPLEESKHSFNLLCLTETWLNDHQVKINSIFTYQITKEFIMKEKLTKEGWGSYVY